MCVGLVLCYTFHRQDKTIPHNREVWKLQKKQFSTRHSQNRTYVLMMAVAIVLLIHGRSSHLDVSHRIFMQA